MRFLITGGAGFIGSNLAKYALARGVEITVLDDLSTGYFDNIADLPLKFVRGSVIDRPAVRESLRGVDRVVHLAALGSVPRSLGDPLASHAANATGTLTLLEEARAYKIEHFTVSSSSSVYGLNPALPKNERQWVRPMSPYAVSKLATEQYVLAYQQSFNMCTIAFRLFNVYGPGQRARHPYAAVIPRFIDAVRDGRPMQINGSGEQSRDFTFVGTTCSVLFEAATQCIGYAEPVNLAFGTNTSLNQLARTVAAVAQVDAEVEYREPRRGDVMHSRADNATLMQLFPAIEPVLLVEGLTETFHSFVGEK